MDIKTQKKEKWLVFYIEGRLEVRLSQALEDQLMNNIGKGENFILFNLTNVEYMSSSGLRVFIASLRKLKEKNGEVRLCNMSNSVRKVLKIVDLESMFNIFETEEEALLS